MYYCKKCILPSTRPNLEIDSNGFCNACKTSSSSNKKLINWSEKEEEFKSLLTRNITNNSWDCVIPVSGGKDSTWQVLTALKYKLKPLCITWKTPARNSLGVSNLQNLISLGVDHIEFTVNPKVEKHFTKLAFIKKGIPLIPMHLAIYNLPIRIANNLNIPLVFYGENSAVEYGGDPKYHNYEITREWILKFGVNANTTAEDWISEDLSEKDLIPYTYPKNIINPPKAVFLSNFFEWNVFITRDIAIKHGLKVPNSPQTGIHNFSDIDDEFLVGIHHWLKWYKFGFKRTWDNLSLEIREGKLNRKQAIDLLINTENSKKENEQIEKFCDYLEISKDEFFEISNKFRNKLIWTKNNNEWIIKEPLHPCLNK
tara:strand:- start:5609 stop:6718 length:1110 start_codon:yes stop_codon:yes gene_type:complete